MKSRNPAININDQKENVLVENQTEKKIISRTVQFKKLKIFVTVFKFFECFGAKEV